MIVTYTTGCNIRESLVRRTEESSGDAIAVVYKYTL